MYVSESDVFSFAVIIPPISWNLLLRGELILQHLDAHFVSLLVRMVFSARAMSPSVNNGRICEKVFKTQTTSKIGSKARQLSQNTLYLPVSFKGQ